MAELYENEVATPFKIVVNNAVPVYNRNPLNSIEVSYTPSAPPFEAQFAPSAPPAPISNRNVYYTSLIEAIATKRRILARDMLSYDKLSLDELEKIKVELSKFPSHDVRDEIRRMINSKILDKYRELLLQIPENNCRSPKKDANPHNLTLMDTINSSHKTIARIIIENDILSAEYLQSCLDEIDRLQILYPKSVKRQQIRILIVNKLNKM